MTSLDSALAPFDYALPPELVAQSPAIPRDSAKMLVYDRGSKRTSFDIFRNIIDYLPHDCVLVFNQTKVFPARMRLTKETGGKISVLYLEEHHGRVRTMAEGKLKPGDRLDWEGGHFFMVEERDGKFAMLKPSFPMEELRSLLETYGETPLPPYIKESPLTEEQRRAEYQTVYAQQTGSVAAPTAGLHFTDDLIKKIEQSGRHVRYVTLHVGLGTFAPVTEEHWKEKKLHEEWYEIDPATAHLLNEAKREHRPIIAVGTTTVRTLESAAQPMNDPSVETPRRGVSTLQRLTGVTDIFITENDRPQFVDGLVTNFHVPRSSLLMLVSAFTGRERLLDLYRQAIDQRFRFFSFGDGMLII
ncbi:MAG TPA: tRNA preQ1(34) S-adenosylmethionine ribosyltransferase-isomerase QueA [Candidatus Peribacteraceae bacterium]|nr:tRNA preQ1(34) S-adenosylmethionine ribosyltransferase-isomerase QueA [Candidatus Peribacteraceae bacterium]